VDAQGFMVLARRAGKSQSTKFQAPISKEIRNPNVEIRNKSESRMGKLGMRETKERRRPISNFKFQI
jgi:hypothetical protein